MGFDQSPAGKAPWRPGVSGATGFLFGPVAAGIVTYVNLKRLGEAQKAKMVLWLSLIGSLIFTAVILMLPDKAATAFGKFGGQLISIAVFPPLQKKLFKEWVSSHPQVVPSSGWGAAGLGILGLILYLLMAVGIGMVIPSK